MNKEELWEKCQSYIRDRIPEQAYQTWFDGIKPYSLNEEEITLQVPNQFHFEWLESKYRILIDDALKKEAKQPLIVNYSIVISNKNSEKIPSLTSNDNPIPQTYHQRSQLNLRYTFENFIEGKSNMFAKAAAINVSDSPGQTPYNPLLIYSNPGLGKTHLLQAIGNSVLRANPNLKVVYLTSEKFMLDFISAIQKNKSAEFSNTYRQVDMLLLDDAQFFQSKEATQEQFFHLFNNLYQQGKQIVLTTDRHPNELTKLKERLISRFQSGLIVDISQPDLETRIAILMKKAEDENLEIPYNVTEFIASGVTSDIRSMEGALVKLLALSSLKREDITISLARQVLKDLIGESAFLDISINHVSQYVCNKMEVNERQINGKSRTMNIALARQIAMYLSRELTKSSLSNIGMHFGKRDHSTVIHACKTIETKINNDKEFETNIKKMKQDLSTKSK